MNLLLWESKLEILLTLLHSERPKLYTILAFLSAIGLKKNMNLLLWEQFFLQELRPVEKGGIK